MSSKKFLRAILSSVAPQPEANQHNFKTIGRQTGTLTITAAAPTIMTGTGTTFTTSFVGSQIYTYSGQYIGKVASYQSDIALTLTAPAACDYFSETFAVNNEPFDAQVGGPLPEASMNINTALVGTITTTIASATVTGVSTLFTSGWVGAELFTTANVYIGTISTYASATSVNLFALARAPVSGAALKVKFPHYVWRSKTFDLNQFAPPQLLDEMRLAKSVTIYPEFFSWYNRAQNATVQSLIQLDNVQCQNCCSTYNGVAAAVLGLQRDQYVNSYDGNGFANRLVVDNPATAEFLRTRQLKVSLLDNRGVAHPNEFFFNFSTETASSTTSYTMGLVFEWE